MLSMQYLQTIVAIFITVEITYRLSKDIYKTREKQKAREGILKLNWTMPNIANKIENDYFIKKYIHFTFLLHNDFSILLKCIHNPQTKLTIKITWVIIFIVVFAIIMTGVVLKIF